MIQQLIPDHIFYVDALNLAHGTWNETYGPFPGNPTLTFEFVRENEFGEHLFEWIEKPEDPECRIDATECENPNHWHRLQDDPANPVAYGWRRVGAQGGNFAIPRDRFWFSDLGFRCVPNTNGLRFDDHFNDLPQVATNPVTSHENWE